MSDTYDGSYRIRASIDTSNITKGVSNVGSSLNGLSSLLKGLASQIAVAFSVSAIVNFGKECVELASDMAEVSNVVSKSFEGVSDGTQAIDDLANNAIQTLGISRLTAYQTGSTFMAMGKSMVSSADDAETMAIELTKLSANMASFYNVSQDVASTALKSVYTGETETLKQYGIVMTETNLKEFALAQGITKSYSEMSQAEKVMLRYNYVMQQTSFIGNDFADTSSGWANQTRILSESWKEFMLVIGSGLKSVLLPCIQMLNGIVTQLIGIAKSIGTVLAEMGIDMGTVATDTEAGVESYNDLADAVDEYGDATAEASQKASGLQGFEELNNISTSADGTSGSSASDDADAEIELAKNATVATEAVNAQAQSASTAFGFIKTAFEGVVGYFSKFGEKIQNLYSSYILPLVNSTKGLVNALGSFILGVVEPILPIIEAGIDTFINVFLDQIAGLIKVITGIVDVLTGILDFITGVFTGDWEQAWNGIKEIFKGVLEVIWGTVKVAFGVLEDLVGGYIDSFIASIKWVGKVVGTIFSGISSLLNSIFSNIANSISNTWNGAVSGAKAMWSNIQQPINDIGSFITGIFTKVGNVISGVWNSFLNGAKDAWSGVTSVFSSVASFFGDIFSDAWQRVKDVFSTGGKVFDGIKDGILSAFKEIVNTLIRGINTIVAIPFNGINTALKSIRDIEFMGISPFKNIISTIDIPTIPQLANGGITTGSTLANIGEAGREAILPLENNTGWMDDLAEKLASKMGTAVTFQVEGDPNGLFKVTQQQARNYMRRTGREAF